MKKVKMSFLHLKRFSSVVIILSSFVLNVFGSLFASPLMGSPSCDFSLLITLGSTNLWVTIDTGSSTLIVQSTSCTNGCYSNKPEYNGQLFSTKVTGSFA